MGNGRRVFNAYVSCDLPPATVKGARASGIRAGKQGKTTLLVCSYGEGVNFTWWTRAECKPDASTDCIGAACKSNCN